MYESRYPSEKARIVAVLLGTKEEIVSYKELYERANEYGIAGTVVEEGVHDLLMDGHVYETDIGLRSIWDDQPDIKEIVPNHEDPELVLRRLTHVARMSETNDIERIVAFSPPGEYVPQLEEEQSTEFDLHGIGYRDDGPQYTFLTEPGEEPEPSKIRVEESEQVRLEDYMYRNSNNESTYLGGSSLQTKMLKSRRI